jgi:prepilin-type N-terminal cleavage/methylation domain-containing protein
MARHTNLQRGFTLAEILVAIAIFAIIFVAALTMYDQSNRVFKRGVESAETQQNVRVSFDKLVADIRMLGFDFDRDGIPTGSTSAVWQPNRTYGVGNLVTPPTANGFVYRMTPVAGGASSCTSSAGPVAWPTAVGAFVTEGSPACRWQALQGLNQYQQPDEQIEFAHPSALTVRGNFDYEMRMPGDVDNGREPALESQEFPVVTTGNDEIVTYALRSDNGPNPDTITFFADVVGRKAFPGTGGRPENVVRIPRVNFGTTTGTFGGRNCTADDPCFPNAPYTLYRFTLDENGAPIETPLASNIRSISFKYYNNVTGVPAAAIPSDWASTTRVIDAGGGQYNPATPNVNNAARNARSVIQSVRVTIIGMSEAQESNFTNPLETAGPFKGYRTYRLESLVVPRNIGRQGMREIPAEPPGSPILNSVTFGYCAAVKLDWLAPIATSGQGNVESYAILYNTVNDGTFPFVKDAGPNTEGTVTGLVPSLTYYFTVAAVNSYGNQIALVPGTTTTAVISAQPQNQTKPGPPDDLASAVGTGGGVSAAQPNKITVSFGPTTRSVTGALQQKAFSGGTTPLATPAAQLYGEIVTYKVYRSTDPNFTPIDTGSPSANEISTTAPNSLQITNSGVTFTDETAPNCIRYYYRFKPIEYCGQAACAGTCNVGAAHGNGIGDPFPAVGTPGIAAMATASNDPKAPIALRTLPASLCTGSQCDVYLTWPRVNEDVEDPSNSIVVDKYRVTRTRMLNGAVDADRTAAQGGRAVQQFDVNDPTPTATPEMTWADLDIPSRNPGAGGGDYEYVYEVRAMQCPDTQTPPVYRMSAPSPSVKFPCSFLGTIPNVNVTLTMDGDGTSAATAWLTNNPASNVVVTFADATNIASVQALLDDGAGGLVDLGTVSAAPYAFPLVNTQIGQIYQLYVIARDTAGCARTETRWVEEATATGCCLAAQANDVSVVSYTPLTNFVDIRLKNLCGQPLNIQNLGVQITWDPVIAGNLTATQISSVEFPSTATGTAVANTALNPNANAPIGAILPRVLSLTPPTSVTPPARTSVDPDTTSYIIRYNFNKILTSTNSPIVKACITYLRTGIDTASQNCQIIPQPPSFNTCN